MLSQKEPQRPKPPEELDSAEIELVGRFVSELVSRRLTAPAIFMLEGMRPMNFVLSQGMVFISPLIKILFEAVHFDQVQEMLEKRGAIPYIIDCIEFEEEVSRGQKHSEVDPEEKD